MKSKNTAKILKTKKTAFEEWSRHDPFQRASIQLIRRVQKEQNELKKSKLKDALL